jgi:hypothetical protein
MVHNSRTEGQETGDIQKWQALHIYVNSEITVGNTYELFIRKRVMWISVGWNYTNLSWQWVFESKELCKAREQDVGSTITHLWQYRSYNCVALPCMEYENWSAKKSDCWERTAFCTQCVFVRQASGWNYKLLPLLWKQLSERIFAVGRITRNKLTLQFSSMNWYVLIFKMTANN